MGFLDNSTITVDAILTKKGREILSRGGDFNITKFALSDEEVDYTLYDVTHPNGTDSYGAVIENMSLLEAAPNRTTFNSFLTSQTLAGVKVVLDTLSYTNVEPGVTIAISPTTKGGTAEEYIFAIENTNILKFVGDTAGSVTANSVEVKTQSFGTPATATTTIQVTGVETGVTNVITVSVKADNGSQGDAMAASFGNESTD